MNSNQCLEEIREFATFPRAVQRYIKVSLDVARNISSDPVEVWSRNRTERKRIRDQQIAYKDIPIIEGYLSNEMGRDDFAFFCGYTIPMGIFDLKDGPITTFVEFRFLYERILGPNSKIYLAMIYSAVIAAPHINSDVREKLFDSIHLYEVSAPIDSFDSKEPAFIPTWVSKVT